MGIGCGGALVAVILLGVAAVLIRAHRTSAKRVAPDATVPREQTKTTSERVAPDATVPHEQTEVRSERVAPDATVPHEQTEVVTSERVAPNATVPYEQTEVTSMAADEAPPPPPQYSEVVQTRVETAKAVPVSVPVAVPVHPIPVADPASIVNAQTATKAIDKTGDRIAQLKELASLKADGAITEEEFAQEKAAILSG